MTTKRLANRVTAGPLGLAGTSSPTSVYFRQAVALVTVLVFAFPLMPSPLAAAELEIDDGVVVKFGAGARLVVRDRIVAGKGIVLTSQRDDGAMGQLNPVPQSPQPGDWLGLRLEKSAEGFGALTLSDLTIRYAGATDAEETAAALSVRGWNPTLQNLLVADNGVGLRVVDGAAPTITGSSFLRNGTGIEADDDSAPAVSVSQFVGNSVLAIDNKTPGTVIQAIGNWWGHSSGPKEVDSNPDGLGDAVSPGVNFDGFVTEAPLLNPRVRLAEPASYFDQRTVMLDLSCVNATEYRLVEGETFTDEPFQPLTDNRARVAFTTSAGDGFKEMRAEFRNVAGTVVAAGLEGAVLIDSGPPSLTLTNPASGSVISQPITIDARASDGSGIAKVEFFIDDRRVAGVTAAPFSYAWDIGGSPDGTHSIRVVATDMAGRTSERTATITLSRSVPATDSLGPQLADVAANGDLLADGTTLARSATISFTASDPSGIARIALLLDGIVVSVPSGNGSYQALLDLDDVPDGQHRLSVRATDSLANDSVLSYTINVVHAPPAAPVLTQPADGSVTFTATVAVSGTAQPGSDVKLLVNAQSAAPEIVAGSDGRFAVSVTLSAGSNRIQATATDRYGTGPASNVVLVTLDRTVPASPGTLTATARAAGKVRLTWTRSMDPNAVGYDLYRASTAFDSITQATKVNAGALTGNAFDDVPPRDGTWAYRVVAVNPAGTPSLPSNLAQAVSDGTLPHALSIAYTPLGKVDPATGRVGQGQVDVLLTASEMLLNAPFLSIVPQGHAPIAVPLTQTGNTTYAGSFEVDAETPSGLANALFSARDRVGNRGTEIDDGATLSIDTAGPALSAIALDPMSPINNDTLQAVKAALTFSKPPKEPPQVSALLSGTGRTPIPLTGLAPVDPITWTGSFDLPSDAGVDKPETLTFISRAVDDLDNVSTEILASNRFQVYQGALPPLEVPFGFTAKAQPDGKVELAWQAVDQAESYQLYRQAPGQTELQALTRASGTDYLDQTPEDGTYRYAVASVRRANGQEAISGWSPPVTVEASATPPAPPRNLALRLTGQGIVAEWQAPWQGKGASYNLYRASGTGLSSVDGLTPIKTGIKEEMAIDATPSATEGDYAVTALDEAGNESAPSNSAYLNASLLPVSRLKIDRVGDDLPIVGWTAPNGDIAGYHIYVSPGENLPDTRLTPNPILDSRFVDAGYNGGDRLYTVASVDANGVEMPRSVLLPDVTATVAGGLPIERGVMNQLQVRVVNHSASALDNVRIVVRLPTDEAASQFRDHPSRTVDVDAGATLMVPVVVGGYAALPDTVPAQLRVEIVPNEGELVTLSQDEVLDVTEGSLVVGMSTYDFTRGATGKVKLTIENITETEVELLTATQNGQGDSTDLRFKILDQDGNVLATQSYKQALGANVVTLPNGQTVARIPAGASYVSDEFALKVPASGLTDVKVRLEVDKLRYHTGKADEIVIAGRGSEKTVSLVDTAYFGEVTDVAPVSSFGDRDIVIAGRAIDRATNTPLPNTRIKLVLNQQGFERVFSVLTDGAGSFTYAFRPELTDAGFYKVSAVHPDATDRPERKFFTINRVTVGPTPFKLDLPKNMPYMIPLTAKAGPGSDATHLKLTFDADSQPTGELPAGIGVQLPAPVSLSGGQSTDLPVVFTATDEAQLSGSLILNVLSDEHGNSPIGRVKVNYLLTEAKPFLASVPSFVETGLAQGDSRIESVKVQNKGLEEARNLSFKLTQSDGGPAPAWTNIVSRADGTMAVGEERSIDLSFTPPVETADGIYEFRLVVTGDNVPEQTLNVFVSVTQSGQGDVLFKAADIYTATADKDGNLIQGLAGAAITVQNEDVPTVTQELVTDSLGEAFFQDLPSGHYRFRATAPNHQELGGRLEVKPGITVNQSVFLQYDLITVDWSVREITIKDRYEITLNATFETDVPAAVIVLEPGVVNLPKMGVGDVFYGELTLTNYGLVRADNVEQQLPKSDRFFRYEFLADVPPALEAKQRITIPYRVVALQSFEGAAVGDPANGGDDPASGGDDPASGGGDPAAGGGSDSGDPQNGDGDTAAGGGDQGHDAECFFYTRYVRVAFTSLCANGDTSAGSTSTRFSFATISNCPKVTTGGASGGYSGGSGDGFGGGGATWSALPIDGGCVSLPKGNGSDCQ